MTDSITRHHGLESFLSAVACHHALEAPGVLMTLRSSLVQVNLRGRADDGPLRASCEQVLGQALPLEANTVSRCDHQVYWLGPDEWLVISNSANAGDLRDRLSDAVDGRHAAVSDVSGGQVVLDLSGRHVRDVLAAGCTLDLHPSVFTVGRCARSGLARAGVLLSLEDDAPVFRVIVRRSFASYLAVWIQRVAGEYGWAAQVR